MEPSLRISSGLILVHKFKLDDGVEFELCNCTATIRAVQKTVFLRKLYDMQYFLKQNLENPVQLSPLQVCEMHTSSSDYTSTDRKLLQLYTDLDAAHNYLHNPHQAQWSTLYGEISCYIQIFTDITLLLDPTG